MVVDSPCLILLVFFLFMVAIRLSRIGKKNHPTFRVIVSDKKKDTHGTALEIVGTVNPHTSPATVVLNADRIKHWLSVGAQPSDTVHNLLVEHGVIPGPKRTILRVSQPAPAAESAAPAAPETETPATA